VSHGCVRLYPEDIERLFPLVPVGAPGEFTYQPVKVGTRGGVVYVETHRDIYGYTPAPYQEAASAIERTGVGARVDHPLLVAALEDPSGMPIPVSPEPNGQAHVVPAGAAVRQDSAPEREDDGASHTDHDQAGDD